MIMTDKMKDKTIDLQDDEDSELLLYKKLVVQVLAQAQRPLTEDEIIERIGILLAQRPIET